MLYSRHLQIRLIALTKLEVIFRSVKCIMSIIIYDLSKLKSTTSIYIVLCLCVSDFHNYNTYTHNACARICAHTHALLYIIIIILILLP